MALAIKATKASTSALIMPYTLIHMWDLPYVSVSKVVLGPLVPFTFWSQYEATKLVSKWPGTADYHVLKHPEEVQPEKLDRERVSTSFARAIIFCLDRLTPNAWQSTIMCLDMTSKLRPTNGLLAGESGR
jgi:hypothetical protein